MSISRSATSNPARGESPERELYGFRGSKLFGPLDLTLYEVDITQRAALISPSPSNTEFVGTPVVSGPSKVGTIVSGGYQVPGNITKPFVTMERIQGIPLDNTFNLDSYRTPRPTVGMGVSLFGGRTGTVKSDGLVSRPYTPDSVSVLDVFEVDFGVLDDEFHGSQVFISSPRSGELLGMLIATSKGAGSFSLVFPADSIR